MAAAQGGRGGRSPRVRARHRELVRLSRGRGKRDFARLAVAQGSLFCLVVQKSGMKTMETDDTLSRFAAPIEALLA